MATLPEHLTKKASDIAKRDVIFLYPEKNRRLVRKILREGDATEKTYRTLVERVKATGHLPPEAEWVFDHFYLIQHRWLDLRADFNTKTFLSLPQLGSGPFKGYPRAYNLIVQLLLLTNNKVNAARVIHFLNGYQKNKPLLISELTSLPQLITLEVVLSFKRKLEEIIDATEQTKRADALFERFVMSPKGGLKESARALAHEIDVRQIYCVAHLWDKLEGGGMYQRTLQRWLKSHLNSHDTDISLIKAEIEKRKTRSASFFANTIETLKWLPNVNWSELIERVSVAEKILRQDPAKSYSHMDEQGRAFYRERVEFIAKKFKVDEVEIAKATVQLARAYEQNAPSHGRSHVGYFLIEEGYHDLEKAFRYRRNLFDKIKRMVGRYRTAWYFGTIGLFAILSLSVLALFLPAPGSALWIGILLVSLPAALEISIVLTNYLISRLVPPKLPVRLYFKELPREHKTVIVLNSMLTTEERVDEAISNLETNYLNTQDDYIFYAALFDFQDAAYEKSERDKELLSYAEGKIAQLNARHCRNTRDKFFLFCRNRVWNPSENLFMGWERKRGKITEFNRFLLNKGPTSFLTPRSCPAALKEVKYAITLDEDNVLPKESAKLLIGTLSHPLNIPVFDEREQRVVRGYSVIQPHIGIRLPYAHRSFFSKIFSLPTVVDPHTHALSNVYQDVFKSGIYVGKGIYEIRTFSRALERKIPENTVLSHDLLEGSYAKTGLASDIAVFENFPARFNTYLLRLHRWIRGDWQLAGWLFRTVRGEDGKKTRNTLPLIERWKILDNLRRSILSSSLLAGILLGIFLQSFPILLFTGIAFCLPFALPVLSYITKRHKHIPFLNLLLKIGALVTTAFTQIFFRVVFLLTHAATEISAVAITFFRTRITKRNLLEWQTYQELVTHTRGTLQETLRIMALPFALSLAFLAYALAMENFLFYPFALFWVLSPFLGFAISKSPPPPISKNLKEEDLLFLRMQAARMWTYYQTFVTEETNFLPPDNVQRGKVVSPMTSPTNIGAYFLGMISAWKLGHIPPAELVERARLSLETVEKLSKQKGHLYNWYNIKTLASQPPEYVSSVDSGNFIASLLVLQEALREIRDKGEMHISARMREAVRDYLLLVREEAVRHRTVPRIKELSVQIDSCIKEKEAAKVPASEIPLADLENFVRSLPHPERYEELLFWTRIARARVNVLCRTSSWAADHQKIEELMLMTKSLVRGTDFQFLYNKEHNLFHIGHNLSARKRDTASYDLFGSEANITSFVSIALNQIEQLHWQKLNRTLINSAKGPVLLSWGGSLFEYVNNLIFFRAIPGSLLWENGKKVVKMHMRYARQKGIPWGMSESAHFASRTSEAIHYRIFGVPEIGVKRDLAQYTVVAPYASFISLSFSPKEAVRNLMHLRRMGMSGRFGFYDSVDFTDKSSPRLVPVHYAHHLGFSLASVCNYVMDEGIQDLFAHNPYVAAAEYLLEELYIVDTKPSRLPRKELYEGAALFETAGMPIKEFVPPQTEIPQSMFLSNGTLSVAVSNNGMSRLAYRDTLLTPFSRFEFFSPQGWRMFLEEKEQGAEWSPVPAPAEEQKGKDRETPKYRVAFYENLAEFTAKHRGIDSRVDVTVSPHEHMEVRKLTLENTTGETRRLTVRTKGAASLAHARKELLSPYFHRLFLRSRVFPEHGAWLIARSYLFPDDEPVRLLHWITSPHRKISVHVPKEAEQRSSGKRSWFDPSSSFESVAEVELGPHEHAVLYCITGAIDETQDPKEVIGKFAKPGYCRDLFEHVFQYENKYLRALDANYTKAKAYRTLGSHIFWRDPAIRYALPEGKTAPTCPRDFLWRFGISGDYPLVVVSAGHADDIPRVRDFIGAYLYLRFKGVQFDLIIVDEEEKSYTEPFREQIETILYAENLKEKAHIHFIPKTALTEEELLLLKNIAEGYFQAKHTMSMGEQKPREEQSKGGGQKGFTCTCEEEIQLSREPLFFANGYGGFSERLEGSEYVISGRRNEMPEAPWTNFLANEEFGCITSQYGLGSTWYKNSQQNRITPWSFFPGRMSVSELFSLREESCEWSLTPDPLPNANPYRVAHGKGYTSYENRNHGMYSSLSVFVHPEEPCKFYRISLRNDTDKEKEVSLSCFLPFVLRDFPEFQLPLQISYLEESGIFLAEQTIANGTGVTKAGLWSSEKISSWTPYKPHIFSWNHNFRRSLPSSRSSSTNSYPGAGLVSDLRIPPGKQKDVLLVLAAGENTERVHELISRFQNRKESEKTLSLQRESWKEKTSSIRVRTPSPHMNTLFNHWLLYQTIASRLYAKTGVYQQGGAIGFRDQIQDILALVHQDPQKVRSMLLHFASKQFEEGDALNWWHEPEGLGIRTMVSDVHLWLPYAVFYYLKRTGDESILEEEVPYVEAPHVDFGAESSWMGVPSVTEKKESLYQHVVRALRKSLQTGAHGLPLMGTGDWNDGLNLIGKEGKGESVWLACFLFYNLSRYAKIAEKRGDHATAEQLAKSCEALEKAVARHGWNGKWFLRAFHDEHVPIGTDKNKEYKIDLLTQSWSIIAGLTDHDKRTKVLEAVAELLYDKEQKIFSLLAPPLSPHMKIPYGYAQGYPKYTRENGAQYNHATVWFLEAAAKAGRNDLVREVLEAISPIARSDSREKARAYEVDPYVVAADIWKEQRHPGKGGWTWYTASSGLLYRVFLEDVLGLKVRGGTTLYIDPCVPSDWKEYEVSYRFGSTDYEVKVLNRSGTGRKASSCTLNGKKVSPSAIPLTDDGKEKKVVVIL